MSSDERAVIATSSAAAGDAAPAIRVAHLGKQYQLGSRATHRTLREALVDGARGVARSFRRNGVSHVAELDVERREPQADAERSRERERDEHG